MAGLRRRIARALDPGPGVDFETAERSLLDLPRLAAVAADHREGGASAEPCPHAVIDGLFDDAVLERVLREFSTERKGSFVENLPGHVAAKRSIRDEPSAVGVYSKREASASNAGGAAVAAEGGAPSVGGEAIAIAGR